MGLSLAWFRRCRLRVSGEVKDVDGAPIAGCGVELLRRWWLTKNWTGYVAREVLTDAAGLFRFDCIAPPGSSYRPRVRHANYQEWVQEAIWSGPQAWFHVTLAGVSPGRPRGGLHPKPETGRRPAR